MTGSVETHVAITGTGAYTPARVLTNADLEKMVDTSDEWIFTRSGIRERRIAADNEYTSDMAAQAAQNALAAAGLAPDALEMIIIGTATPDMAFPNTGCLVQRLIGAKNAFCMDLSAACSGFLYSLDTAAAFIKAGRVQNALVIGAEKLSAIVDWQDRNTCVLFGDGAGAVVLQKRAGPGGLLTSVLGSDGNLSDLLQVPGGGSRNPASEQTVRDRLHYIRMTGREVFKHAVNNMVQAAKTALDQAGLKVEDIACVIPHQANSRIVEAISDRFGGNRDKFFVNLDKYGNTSAASIPVALDEAVRSGRIQRGDKVLLVAFGGGFTWGAVIVEWS